MRGRNATDALSAVVVAALHASGAATAGSDLLEGRGLDG
jgi:hypothetical protein